MAVKPAGDPWNDASVITVSVDRHPGLVEARNIALLHRDWSLSGRRDDHALSPGPVVVDQLTQALAATDSLVTVQRDGQVEGYGRLIGWSETDGTQVQLLDAHTGPSIERDTVDELLLTALEKLARDRVTGPRTVLGANADSDDHERIALLTRLGYTRQLEMVELQLERHLTRGPLPTALTIRCAQPDDAEAIAELTTINWAGRPYFTGLSAERITGWLERNDPNLFLLAEGQDRLVGLAVADIGDRVVEVEDLGVHPDWRRRGLALGLMTELLDRIRARTALPIRLLTEGHDPSGALTLYQRIGFVVVRRHGRYRKPLS